MGHSIELSHTEGGESACLIGLGIDIIVMYVLDHNG